MKTVDPISGLPAAVPPRVGSIAIIGASRYKSKDALLVEDGDTNRGHNAPRNAFSLAGAALVLDTIHNRFSWLTTVMDIT
ncbi:MAG: hypothetical protein ACREDD_05365 [Methylocella sp.]